MANFTVNEVRILGNITRDPAARMIPGPVPRCVINMTVATSSEYLDAAGIKNEISEYHRVVLYDPLASALRDHLKKGNQVYVEGRNQTRKWTNKVTLQDNYVTEVICDKIVKTSASGSARAESEKAANLDTPTNPGAAAVALARSGIKRATAPQGADAEDEPY